MAFTVAECDRMIAAAARHGVRLMVGQVLRLLPLFSRVIDIVDSGVLGQPTAATITRVGWFGDPAARYRLRKETTGGLLYDITVHEIDLLHRIFGPVQTVSALMSRVVLTAIDYEDTAHLLVRFRSGGSATLFESIASPVGESSGVIVGTRGALRYDHGTGHIVYRRNEQPDDEIAETVGRHDGENGYLRELRSFTAWVLHGTTPLLTAQEGRAAIAVVEAAYASAQTGRPVEVSEV
jgi:myo-inositol 2-dehydrogenase/D-chiro-inositol 1-dehydrogenase